jgi:DNA-binding CsgD family transcriptional regulator
LSQAAAQLPICRPHLERAGVLVPAARVVAGQPFCESCFRGEPISSEPTPAALIPFGRPGLARRPQLKRFDLALKRKLRIYAPPRLHPRRHRPKPQAAPVPKRAKRHRVPSVGDALSPREIEVMRAIAGGLRNREIAARLGLVERTIKMHVSNLLRKAGVRHRVALLIWWAGRRAGAPA